MPVTYFVAYHEKGDATLHFYPGESADWEKTMREAAIEHDRYHQTYYGTLVVNIHPDDMPNMLYDSAMFRGTLVAQSWQDDGEAFEQYICERRLDATDECTCGTHEKVRGNDDVGIDDYWDVR